jgi:riboflavin biosynthesis pyrimidine reductase
LAAHLVDEVWWFRAPTILGADGMAAVGPLAIASPAAAIRFLPVGHAQLAGDDVIVLRPAENPLAL